ncbi:hypothetical protein DEO72_LG8g1407 [Vigna unguiculata]|uniref:Uncharacterized protein n=1 Tax=Vigna unguiculata TaxID=3917 RepID=A0A4D6MPR3_VIGUN|nr:hypothetical protein DEO72_LG8g1407 [Vigna unguiculata]
MRVLGYHRAKVGRPIGARISRRRALFWAKEHLAQARVPRLSENSWKPRLSEIGLIARAKASSLSENSAVLRVLFVHLDADLDQEMLCHERVEQQAEKRNRRCEEEEEEEEEEEGKGFAFLNLNKPCGLDSIFNGGGKPFLALVQFHPRPNITALVAFLKYWPTFRHWSNSTQGI